MRLSEQQRRFRIQAQEFNALGRLFAQRGDVNNAVICRGLAGHRELTRRTKEQKRVERDV